jgi:hypothetical protein
MDLDLFYNHYGEKIYTHAYSLVMAMYFMLNRSLLLFQKIKLHACLIKEGLKI